MCAYCIVCNFVYKNIYTHTRIDTTKECNIHSFTLTLTQTYQYTLSLYTAICLVDGLTVGNVLICHDLIQHFIIKAYFYLACNYFAQYYEQEYLFFNMNELYFGHNIQINNKCTSIQVSTKKVTMEVL